MRATLIMLPLYAAMIGTPMLLVLRLFAVITASWWVYPLSILVGLGLIVFGGVGFMEVFVHEAHESRPLGVFEGKKYPAPKAKKNADTVKVSFVVKRFNEKRKQMEVDTYVHNADKLTTVLGALVDIKEKQDNTLSMRYSCRMGICGSCGMVVNGKPSLVCETNVLQNVNEDGEIVIEPMEGHPLLKDLTTDFDDFFEKHMSVQPRLYRIDAKEQHAAKREYKQTSKQVDKFLPYSYCIMCGLCEDACPVSNTNPDFIGPQALAQSYRYYADSRDQMGKTRILAVDSMSGVWGCEFAGACSKVCPKGVDPAAAIQLLKTELMTNVLDGNEKEVK